MIALGVLAYLFIAALLVSAVYVMVKTAHDFRAGRHAWAIAGIISLVGTLGLLLLLGFVAVVSVTMRKFG